jgi:transcriptional regulator with XRE-family HTH domain
MASLGQELRDEREARHISIEEIASATKIGSRYLQALEADHLDLMPGEFFIKGIIRTYSRAIGLDGEVVLAKYKAAGLIGEPERKRHLLSRSEPAKPEPASSGGVAPKPAAEPEVQPVPQALPEPPAPTLHKPAPEPEQAPVLKPPPEQPILADPKPDPAPDPAERLIVRSAPEAPRPSRLKLALATVLRTRAGVRAGVGIVVVLAVIFLLVVPMLRRPRGASVQAASQAPAVSAPVPAPPQKAEPEPPPVAEVVWKGVTIEITFEAATWIMVYADGVLKATGTFPPGSTAKAQADERLLIHTGNAGGFSFLLNGKAAKPLGRSGQVITDIKITPDNFKDFLEAESPARPTG